MNILFLFIIVGFLFSTICLIWCIKPKIRNAKPPKEKSNTHTVLFYGSIVHIEDTEEIKRVTSFSDNTIINDINNQSWICSGICMEKRKYIFWAICGIIFCLVLFIVMEIVKHL